MGREGSWKAKDEGGMELNMESEGRERRGRNEVRGKGIGGMRIKERRSIEE